jgi:hypothetical protein
MDPREYSDPTQTNIPYDVVPLPSKGMFYQNKLESVKVTYLTASDENLLSSPNIVESGNIIDELLRRKILGSEVNITEMLECDKQAVLIFLRNTAFGATYEFTLTDPKTKESFNHTHDLSSVSMKEFNLIADEKGEFSYSLPVTKKGVKFKFLSSTQETELSNIDSQYEGRISPKVTRRLEYLIQEIEGERDKGNLAQMIQSMPIKDSQGFRNYVKDNEPGLDLKVTVRAPSGEEVTTSVVLGAHFFRPFFGI